MAVNARTEEFQHIEVFDKPALFTNGRIARDTVPKGWYCYDIRGSDDDPGALCYMEKNVVVNHAGSVLMPEKLAIPKSGRLDVRDELGFLDEGSMTLREFCEAHQLPYPTENMKFHIRPARPEEAGLFYTPHPEEDKRLGTRSQFASSDDKWRKLLDHLSGKEITSAGHLSARNFSFGDEIIESNGKLNYYVQTEFDVDAAFGTFVLTDENDDWLNVYANYDIAEDRPCDTLELTLCKGDGSEENWSYPLNAAEQDVLLRKMEAFCQQQIGMSLCEYAQQLREEQAQTSEMQM